MKESDKNEIILRAAIELSPDYFYEVREGTLGLTLYITTKNKVDSRCRPAKNSFQCLREYGLLFYALPAEMMMISILLKDMKYLIKFDYERNHY